MAFKSKKPFPPPEKVIKGLGPSKKVAEKFIHDSPKRSAFMSAIKGKNGR